MALHQNIYENSRIIAESPIFVKNFDDMDITQRLDAFDRLGKALRTAFGEETIHFSNDENEKIEKLKLEASEAHHHNAWFTEAFTKNALKALGDSLQRPHLEKWVSAYSMTPQKVKTIGVVMAGNVPAVGFHDFLSVLISGHRLQAKLSSDDNRLMPAIADLLTTFEPAFHDAIRFTEDRLQNFDAIIATGSNNTSRYFEYYFGKYPHIIRKNRNGIAVLDGTETKEQLNGLADDIFLYYGLGCRNVSKIFVPSGYNFTPLLDILTQRKSIAEHHKYFNNYEYNKAIYLVNGRQHYDTGNLLLVEDEKFASSVSVLHYEFYNNLQSLGNHLLVNQDKIQCVLTQLAIKNAFPLGKSQEPALRDYADGIDTLDFLQHL